MTILAGDIGGTKTAFGLFTRTEKGPVAVRVASLPSTGYPSLEAAVTEFLSQCGDVSVQAACFAVAGPVVNGTARLTNLPWRVDEAALAPLAGRVCVINDLQAAARGSLHMNDVDFRVLSEGQPVANGNIGVIAAGTGLGEAFLVWDGRRYIAMACEGGHADFAPRNEEEFALLQYIQREIGGHVSYEHVLSGAGLMRIYRFLRERSGIREPDELTVRLANGDPAAAIAAAATLGDPFCARALEMFASIYGAEAGNLALKVFALGGIVIAGGIGMKNLAELQKGGFMAAFTAKGRFAELLGRVPVKVIINPNAALSGAAHYAMELEAGGE